MPAHFSQTLRALKRDNAQSSYMCWAISALLVCVWSVWFFCSSVTVYETSDKVRLEAKMAPRQIEAQISGQVLSTYLAIGKDVVEGDIVMEIDAREERLRRDEEVARLKATTERLNATKREIAAKRQANDDDGDSAAADVDMIKSRIAAIEAETALASDIAARMAKLVATGNGTQIASLKATNDLKRLKAERKSLDAELRRAVSQSDRKKHDSEAGIEDLQFQLAQLDGEYESSKAAIERLNADIEKRLIRSPITGHLGDVLPFHSGSFVAQGSPLATVIPSGELIAVAQFAPSVSIGRVKAGQIARLKLDAFPWTQFGVVDAQVVTVANEPRDNTLRVELAVDAVRAQQLGLQHGLPGVAEVQIEDISPARLVLRAAGFTFGGGTPRQIAGLQ